MSRFTSSGSYGQSCDFIKSRYGDYYRMSWVVDYYYNNSRGRYPRQFSRDTADAKAAQRFCERWGILFPDNTGAE